MADGQAQAPERRQGREGSRWLNERPTGTDVADWFEENVALHEGLAHKDYVSGVTLIQQTEKTREVIAWSPENRPVTGEVSNIVYVPYAKVEARVKYFQDLMRVNGDEWVGFIEPVPVAGFETLPPGFFMFKVPTDGGRAVIYVCCSMKVTVYKRGSIEYVEVPQAVGRSSVERRGEIVIDAPPGTKMIPTLGKYGPDPNALMKAETGAVGRALGLAGMLVIPGTGIATAEDLAEAEALARTPQQPVEPETPTEARSPQEVLTELRQQAATSIAALKQEDPDRFEAFRAWAAERGVRKVAEIEDEPMLRGLATKVERELAEARAESPQPEEDDPGRAERDPG